jgi:PAS domain S-box-containing protein
MAAARPVDPTPPVSNAARQKLQIKTSVLQAAILSSATFSKIVTDERGLIQIFNVGAERMFGHAAADVINRLTPADITEPDELRARAVALSAELGTPVRPGFEALVFKARLGIEDAYELTYIRKDGSRLPTVVSVTALQDAADAIIGYLLIGTDNTARQQVELERLRLAEALQLSHVELEKAKLAAEAANLAKSDFLSCMSHELRSPLNAILGFAQLMQSGTPAPTADQADSTEQILKAGWYLLALINEILDLALIESGRLSLSPEPVSLAEVLADCQAMFEPQAHGSGIRLTFPVAHDAWLVRADRTRVKQALVNLLSNAIKYNRPGGRVDVCCSVAAPGRLRVSLQDTGDGLSAAKLAQLFQPFNRLGQEGGAQEGTGIGLVVSKRLIELMGGSIGATSTVGTGSLFWIELATCTLDQTADADGVAAPDPTQRPADGAPRRTLLCVEDNPANLMLVQRLMARRPDIDLITARDGRLGVEMARSHLPDVVLMDINLPGISGLTALRLLGNDPATRHIPVIALSANAMPHDVSKGLQAGFFRYLTKPVKVPEFLATLDLALDLARDRQDERVPPDHAADAAPIHRPALPVRPDPAPRRVASEPS